MIVTGTALLIAAIVRKVRKKKREKLEIENESE